MAVTINISKPVMAANINISKPVTAARWDRSIDISEIGYW